MTTLRLLTPQQYNAFIRSFQFLTTQVTTSHRFLSLSFDFLLRTFGSSTLIFLTSSWKKSWKKAYFQQPHSEHLGYKQRCHRELIKRALWLSWQTDCWLAPAVFHIFSYLVCHTTLMFWPLPKHFKYGQKTKNCYLNSSFYCVYINVLKLGKIYDEKIV